MAKSWRLQVTISKVITVDVHGDALVPVETAVDAIRIAGSTRLAEIVATSAWRCVQIDQNGDEV